MTDETFSREEQAESLTKAYFAIVSDWNLSSIQAQALLGCPSESRFEKLRKGVVPAVRHLSEDELHRLAYITGIYGELGNLFSADNARAWVCNAPNPTEPHERPWGAVAPIEYMLSGKMEALVDVYRYVNGMRNRL